MEDGFIETDGGLYVVSRPSHFNEAGGLELLAFPVLSYRILVLEDVKPLENPVVLHVFIRICPGISLGSSGNVVVGVYCDVHFEGGFHCTIVKRLVSAHMLVGSP